MAFNKQVNLADFFEAINNFRKLPILPSPYHKIWRYLSALIIISFALICDLHFQIFHGYPSILVFAAVILSTWYSGFWPGLLTSIIAVFSIDYFFTKPIDQFSFGSNYFAQSIVFISAAILISSLVESQRRAEKIVLNLSNKQKRFLADAAHELFTPLSIIKAQSEVMLHSSSPDLASYREVTLSNIGEVDSMTKMVENLLEISRNQLKIQTSHANFVELTDLAKSVINKIKVLAEGKGIILEVVKEDSGKIKGDATALSHMIINLLQNSILYTQSGGKVSISVIATDKIMKLVIQDTGIGIASEHLPYIFEPFYKADEVRRRRESGAGLGLAIVKSVVDFHKGKIGIESKLNCGTIITVEFPKA